MTPITRTLIVGALAAFSTLSLQAQLILSINVDENNSRNAMLPASLAGANSGIRVDNWNNMAGSKDATITGADGLLYNDGTDVPVDFSLTTVSNATFVGESGASNDALMYGGSTLYRDHATLIDSGDFTFTNIPFSQYDIYVYGVNTATDTGGSVNVGSETFYMRGTSIAASDGTGYVVATSTTFNPLLPGDVAEANYVLFDGLSGSSQTINLAGLDMGSGNIRFRVGGVQIVQIPESSTTAALFGATCLLLVALRRRKS